MFWVLVLLGFAVAFLSCFFWVAYLISRNEASCESELLFYGICFSFPVIHILEGRWDSPASTILSFALPLFGTFVSFIAIATLLAPAPHDTEEVPLPDDPKTLAARIVSGFDVSRYVKVTFQTIAEQLLENAATLPTYDAKIAGPKVQEALKRFLSQLVGKNWAILNQERLFLARARDVMAYPYPSSVFWPLERRFAEPVVFPIFERDEFWYDYWRKRPPPWTTDQEIERYFGGTALAILYDTLVPIELPHEQRFSGMWMPCAPGTGKTTVLNGLIKEHLDEIAAARASIFIMDSKEHPTESLINPWRSVKYDPRINVHVFDPLDGIQINLFDGENEQVIDLFEYMFSSLLETMKLTDYQALLLTKCVLAVKASPNPSILALRDILANGWQKYEPGIRTLPPHEQEFFLTERPDARSKNRMVCDFDSSTWFPHRNEVRSRIERLLSKTPALYETLSATETRVDLRYLMDQGGNVIIVNASTKLLGDRGSEFWQRLWTMLLRNAADHRKTDKPVYVYWDEADTGAKHDLKLASLLDKCRSSKISLTISHQGENQIEEPSVRAALERCAIKLTSDKRGIFNVRVRGVGELELHSIVTDMEALPRLTRDETAMLKHEMRRRYGRRRDDPEGDWGRPTDEPPPKPFNPNGNGLTVTDVDWQEIKPHDPDKSSRSSKKDEENDPTTPAQH
jgi:hypothetical protein